MKAILDAYDEQEYLATLSLAKLYMNDAYAHFVEASAVIDTLEAKWGKDPKKVAEIQNRRGALFLQQGKFDEAEKWVNELYARDKIAAAGPAGLLARALDTQATEKAKAKPGSAEADELWKRAARFYYISIKPQVDSAVAQHAEEMIAVGNRLYSLGLHFNGVPEDRTSFVDWVPGSKKVADYWLKAAEIYEAALAQTPDIAMTINLGRTYGFLAALGDTKRWVQSATLFSKLFTQELIINPKAPNKLDPVVTKAKSSLVGAYLDFGVAEQMSFSVDNDKDHLNRALKVILAPIVNTLKPDTGKELYWGALYHMVRTLIERGEYKDAKLKVEDVQRQVSPTFDEGKFGYKALFEATIAELSTK